MSSVLAVAIGMLAALVESVAVFAVLACRGPLDACAAALLHVCACAGALAAAKARVGARGVELDAVFLTSFFVPLFGPALSWMTPLGPDVSDRGSRRMLEDVERQIEGGDTYERRLYSGDFEGDLSRQLNSLSYREALRKGDLDQKRDALRKLTRLGEPRHLTLVKQALEDSETEVRLCAYLELDRVRTRFETEIAERRRTIEEFDECDGEDHGIDQEFAGLAELHLAYGASGALDDTMTRFQLEQSVEVARHALDRSPWSVDAALVAAEACCELGDYGEAEQTLDRFAHTCADQPRFLELRARAAFGKRDFGRAREVARAMLALQYPVPAWLAVLLGESDATAPREHVGARQ